MGIEMRGLHLILDMYKCSEKNLGDKTLIAKILDELPDLLKLTKLSKPFIEEYSNPTPGISGFVIIGESHISIHTFIEERLATVDIYACKEFDVELAVNYLTSKFNPEKIEKHVLYRML
ncbi:MAG: adenosylmethionine decarboxylase [Nitrososphaerota archaeon]|nr:adenosylmethionine decarboxylase [Candidatus Geocrenenecus dongiae]